jgi:hypothetical protein
LRARVSSPFDSTNAPHPIGMFVAVVLDRFEIVRIEFGEE